MVIVAFVAIVATMDGALAMMGTTVTKATMVIVVTMDGETLMTATQSVMATM